MSENKKWQFELEEYIRLGEPEKIEKSETWQIAIGLQQVDGLKFSSYLLDTAKEHIEGKININEVQERIQSYYEEKTDRKEIENETMEADVVSSRITQLLLEKTFQFSPAELIMIHRRLFEDVFDHAGKIRTYNIMKKEWVLKGDTVIYAPYDSINETLMYDFMLEKNFSYKNMPLNDVIKHLAEFTSNIWQIHPFAEGNTRATAVFIIKYMKSLGFKVNNDAFKKHSWYFRNSLVRANYNDLQNEIYSTTKYLEMFFCNLLLGTHYELKNRYIHVDNVIKHNNNIQSANDDAQKGKICTLEEQAILKIISEKPNITQKEIAKKINKSERTVKNKIAVLKKKGYIQRLNGKRNGEWKILVDKKSI